MRTVNRTYFFNSIRSGPFPGKLTEKQVDGISRILDEAKNRGVTNNRSLAYMLATVFWETGRTMQPIREAGGEKYLRKKSYYPWVGEGLVQVTWERNHRKFGATQPGDLMTWPVALVALFDGMINGMFTGKCLSDYFSSSRTDWFNARRIINGIDKTREISSIAKQFYADLQGSMVEEVG